NGVVKSYNAPHVQKWPKIAAGDRGGPQGDQRFGPQRSRLLDKRHGLLEQTKEAFVTQLPPGIHREKERAFLVEVRVRPFPKRRERFPLETPLEVMVAWRDTQLADLTAAKQALKQTQLDARTTTILATKVRGVMAGTLRADVETYLTEKLRPTMDPHNKLQARRYLRTLAATDLGRYPRQAITGAQLEAVLAKWERFGAPPSPESEGPQRIVPPGALAPDTVNKIRHYWIGFYKAMNLGTTLLNPARAVPRRKPGPIQNRSVEFALAVKILDYVGKSRKPTRTQARLTLMCVLGLRPCEIMRIKPARHWNPRAGTLFVQTAKGGKPRTLDLKPNPRATAALEMLEQLKGWGTFTSA